MCGDRREVNQFIGTMGALMLTSAAQTFTIGPIRSKRDNGSVPWRILKSFIRPIMRSMWMRALAISLFLAAFCPVNCFPILVKGGMTSSTPRSRRSDCILKPLSAIQMSPGSNRFTRWHLSTSIWSDILPPAGGETYETVPCGVHAIRNLTVVVFL